MIPEEREVEPALHRHGQTIDENGWSVQSLGAGPDSVYCPSHAYTLGLGETFSHPEFIILGFAEHTMEKILDDAAKLVKDGEIFDDWSTCDHLVRGMTVVFREIAMKDSKTWTSLATARYAGRPFRVLQIFVPDPGGKFPWDKDCKPENARRQSHLLEGMKPAGCQF